MNGERKMGRNWRKAPVILAMLLVSAGLLTPAGPAGAAGGPQTAEAADTAAVVNHKKAAAAEAAEIVGQTPEKSAQIAREAPPKEMFAPVPESEAVEDDYFDDAVFLGDSRTEGFSLYSGLKTGTYLYGVGATVESVFTKKAWPVGGEEKVPLLDALAEEDCGKIYVMLGINELGWSKKETFQEQYGKVIDRIRGDHPDAEIILQTILPVSAKQDAKGSYVNNERVAVYNAVIWELAEEKECALVDVAAALSGEDGCLPADLNFDGVHLNPVGCRLWLDYLRTHSV